MICIRHEMCHSWRNKCIKCSNLIDLNRDISRMSIFVKFVQHLVIGGLMPSAVTLCSCTSSFNIFPLSASDAGSSHEGVGKILQRFPEKDWEDVPFHPGIELVRHRFGIQGHILVAGFPSQHLFTYMYVFVRSQFRQTRDLSVCVFLHLWTNLNVCYLILSKIHVYGSLPVWHHRKRTQNVFLDNSW